MTAGGAAKRSAQSKPNRSLRSKHDATAARENSPVGRNLERIPTLEGGYLL